MNGPRIAWWRWPWAAGAVLVAAFRGADEVEALFERWSRKDDPKWWAELDAIRGEMLDEERWEWRLGQTARDREVGVEIGCTGSPLCCAAIHIRRTTSSSPYKAPAWEEIHLTPDECQWVIGELHRAVRRWEARL